MASVDYWPCSCLPSVADSDMMFSLIVTLVFSFLHSSIDEISLGIGSEFILVHCYVLMF